MLIETNRLIIRDFENDDWFDIYKYTSDADITKWLPEGIFTEDKAKNFVKKNIEDKTENYAVILKDDNKLIGHMIFHVWFVSATYEIGWIFNKEYHSKGYASEAAMSLIEYGFEELKLHRIIATCQPQNPASYKVMEKVGMRREGYFKKCIPRENGLWWDEYFYAILEEDWSK